MRQHLGLRLNPPSFPKSFMSFAVFFDSFKDVSTREVGIMGGAGPTRGRGRRRCYRRLGGLGLPGREYLHHFIDALRFDDPLRTPVFEDLNLALVWECPKRMLGCTCFVLVRLGRPCRPTGTTHSTI
jgi:hypothetical protein